MSVRLLVNAQLTLPEEGAGDARDSRATDYLAGEVLADRYRLVRQLGQGGMGVVWEARSLALEVDVALKLLRVGGSAASMASRMAREAHAAARLAHPALVRVFDFGMTDRGHPFLVMELVQGETLCRILASEGRMGAIRAVQTLLPVADGLRCAHDQGIIHRDVKPENLFIAKDSFGRLQPKLIDFGIARIGPYAADHRLTQEGVVMGSPAYMSPEQALGHEGIDGRSDLWALCVMLYEMIAGQMPFKNKNYNALVQAILHEDPVPTHLLGAGDAELWRIISKGLAKAPAERYASATELGGALALWLYQHGVKEDVCGNSIRALWLHPTHLRVRGAPDLSRLPDRAASPESLTQTETRPRETMAKTTQQVRESGFGWLVALKRPALAWRSWFVAAFLGVPLAAIVGVGPARPGASPSPDRIQIHAAAAAPATLSRESSLHATSNADSNGPAPAAEGPLPVNAAAPAAGVQVAAPTRPGPVPAGASAAGPAPDGPAPRAHAAPLASRPVPSASPAPKKPIAQSVRAAAPDDPKAVVHDFGF